MYNFIFLELNTQNLNNYVKTVSFYKYTDVILIVPLKEYKDLWWNFDDLINAQLTSLKELNILMKRHNITIKLAKHILYQPFGYNKNNFL
uniref:Uncharacterized protein n=1 Tax=viral metagenome TaxID=1070528 RepID=A0A6C0D9D0_9ZZZZ